MHNEICPLFCFCESIKLSLSAQSCEQQEEEEVAIPHPPLYEAEASLNLAYLGWPVRTRLGWGLMDSPMSEAPETPTTASRETHRACLRRSLLCQSNPTVWILIRAGRTETLFLILALNFLNSPLIIPRYSNGRY